MADVYVVNSMIISSHDSRTRGGPVCVPMYFLAKREDGEYYELFSGRKLEKEKKPEGDFLLQTFDTPYVIKAEHLSKYLRNPKRVTIDIQSLFDFITNKNVLNMLSDFSDESTEEE